jgi:hypothetical protein
VTITNQTTQQESTPPTRVAVQTLVYSELLRPEEITSRLALQPTAFATKGVKHGKRSGREMLIPRHMWQLSSESHVESPEVSSHLDWMLAKLYEVREELTALRSSGEIECTVVGIVWTSGTSAHVRVTASQMQTLLELRLDLDLEFSDYGLDD